MEKISVSVENSYGIQNFCHEFKFDKNSANLIYAPNGVMKTSFAKTLRDYSQNVPSSDRIYTERESKRSILDENGDPVPPEHIFVIEPYLPKFESHRVSSLLANKKLKEEYDQIVSGINAKQEDLLKAVKSTAGLRTDIEDNISETITKEKDSFLRAMERIRSEVLEEDDTLSSIKYNEVFNPKIEDFLRKADTQEKLETYTERYDDLLDKSKFFRKGVFNHFQAGEIAKQLTKHGFFKADHSVYLNSEDEKTEITDEKALEQAIKNELDQILEDGSLRDAFNALDKSLSQNDDLRNFREFLLQNKSLIPELTKPELFKEKLWKSYIIKHRELFTLLMDQYDIGKKRMQEIAEEASAEATKWQEVINIFNRRFSVPFDVAIGNKQDVILKRVTPNLQFQFKDEMGEPVDVKRENLVEILSNGENRALYILNIIFEVQARLEDNIPTLFVIDDIADSFDYKNKYAIVEYLSDILKQGDFRQIILTHNYDFYRTIWRRLELNGSNFHASKEGGETKLTAETMYRNPFEKWKSAADKHDNLAMLIALIPFARNIAEYCGLDDENELLTSLLHIKSNTDEIKIGDLQSTLRKILHGNDFENLEDLDRVTKNAIYEEADRLSAAIPTDSSLEAKITLSIAVRLKAEEFLIGKIADETFVSAISKNQTGKLIGRFKSQFGSDATETENTKIMEKVNLMTPENIHLNSFMYEPILDMSSEHLKRLYDEVSNLG